ncbi:MAG: cupredoxin domain-containing protein [Chloroflexi bacterium]|nr:cupredoxin domain-containing protein [Chloroflexota bacterium]
MKRSRRTAWYLVGVALLAGVLALSACEMLGQGPRSESKGQAPSAQAGGGQAPAAQTASTAAQPATPALIKGPASAPAQPAPAAAYKPGQVPIAMVAAAERTPEMWMEYLGIRLVETRDSSGPPAFTPNPGDLYFVTNESTTWGATNTRNNVVIIDAKTKKPIVQSQLPDEYALNFGSHSVGVSADGKWIYMPAQSGPTNSYLLVINGQTLKLHKVYQTLGRPHHINNLTSADGRELMLVVDFGWNWTGSGIYALDPEKDSIVVGGMTRADFSGHPYIVSGEVGGKYVYATVPAPTAALREKMEGYLAKIETTTWKVVQAIPVGDPIWPEISPDGKTAWVTMGGHSKVAKIDLEKGKVLDELTTGPGPWGARISLDGTKLYVADKGEAYGYGQQGRTMTVIDTQHDIATNVVPIGLTTDHIIISPDGKELWATSNADHSIVVVDADSEQVVATIKMPNDGDTHGSTFIEYRDDGKGGVVGEVVASFTGPRGSALKKQKEMLSGAKAQTIKISPKNVFFGIPSAFNPANMTAKPGEELRLVFANAGGTSGGLVAAESPALGLARTELKPGSRKTVVVKAPTAEGEFRVTNPLDPQGKPLVITIKQTARDAGTPAPAAAAPAVREVKVVAQSIAFEQKEIRLKAGERVRFVLENRDDEKHNIVAGELGLLTPDAGNGKSINYDWVVPNRRGTYKAICVYHPNMVLNLIVQ